MLHSILPGRYDADLVPGPRDFPVTVTPHGEVDITICWDVHRLWIIRELAHAGAEIILLPMDNVFDGTPRFPPFHAADAVSGRSKIGWLVAWAPPTGSRW